MLEGLEIIEKNLSQVMENKDERIDSQYYTKEPLKGKHLRYEKIGKHLIQSQYGLSIQMNEHNEGYPIYRMNEIHNMLCDSVVSKYADINKEEFEIFRLNDRDVLFNRTNSFEWVGRTGIYREIKDYPCVFASYLVRFIPCQDTILPEYLTAYLNTEYGIWDIKRRARQSINQTNVNPEEVKEIEIPLLNIGFQSLVKTCFDQSHINKLDSYEKYQQAEDLLLETLGLKDFVPSSKASNVKSLSESFGTSGRLDAEYYQVKYEEIIEQIRQCNNYKSFDEICSLNDINFIPEENIEYKYIELSNIGDKGEIYGFTEALGLDLPTRARRIVATGDVIVSSIEGSLNSCALITEDYEAALCSNGFHIIRSKVLNPETLLVLFKSNPWQNILKKGCSGTILTAINKSELSDIPIPIIDAEVQARIKERIDSCYQSRQQSEHLLEVAKRAVEIAIEETEESALKFINESMRDMNV